MKAATNSGAPSETKRAPKAIQRRFQRALRDLQERTGWTAKQFAQHCHLPYRTFLNWLAGTACPGKKRLKALCLTLGWKPAQAHGLNAQAPSIEQLACEGKLVIEFSGAHENFQLEGEMSLLHQLLTRIEPENTTQYFRHDTQAGMVFIRWRTLRELIPGTTRKSLHAELRAQNPQVRKHGNHYLVAPADWFLELLASFYGRAVMVSRHPEPTEASLLQDQPQVIPGQAPPEKLSLK